MDPQTLAGSGARPTAGVSEVLQIPYDNLPLRTLSTRPALTGAEVQLSCVLSPGETLPSLITPRWAFPRWRSLETPAPKLGALRMRPASPGCAQYLSPCSPLPHPPHALRRSPGAGRRHPSRSRNPARVGLCRPPARRPHALRDVGQPHRGPIAQTPRPPGPIPSTHQARSRSMTARSAQPRSSGPAYSPRTRPP